MAPKGHSTKMHSKKKSQCAPRPELSTEAVASPEPSQASLALPQNFEWNQACFVPNAFPNLTTASTLPFTPETTQLVANLLSQSFNGGPQQTAQDSLSYILQMMNSGYAQGTSTNTTSTSSTPFRNQESQYVEAKNTQETIVKAVKEEAVNLLSTASENSGTTPLAFSSAQSVSGPSANAQLAAQNIENPAPSAFREMLNSVYAKEIGAALPAGHPQSSYENFEKMIAQFLQKVSTYYAHEIRANANWKPVLLDMCNNIVVTGKQPTSAQIQNQQTTPNASSDSDDDEVEASEEKSSDKTDASSSYSAALPGSKESKAVDRSDAVADDPSNISNHVLSGFLNTEMPGTAPKSLIHPAFYQWAFQFQNQQESANPSIESDDEEIIDVVSISPEAKKTDM
ncbi:unnamed protein product [Caenorhabditis bovis]|uniref:Uncharacterized protein n=1 Tax=Caenorhabditis bovis TaxID=2654633 RepID=A0A8S1FCK5_9PELO|nr:unnamed protein product [Caenorhabditis bovis]